MVKWLKTIGFGFISGAFGGAVISIKDPSQFGPENLHAMIWPCIAFGILGAAAFAAKSPFHEESKDEVSKETLQRIQDRNESSH